MTRCPKLPRHLVATAGVIVGSLIGLGQSARADAPVDSVPARYIVEFAPGAVPVVVKADLPNAAEIPRDAVADAIADDVIAAGGDVLYDYDRLPFIAVSTEDLASIWSSAGVVAIRPDFRVTRALDTSLDVIDAADSDLSAAIGGATADGSGTTVAIIDDGIDRAHPFFADANNQSRVVAEACFVTNDPVTPRSCPNGASSRTGVGAAAHHPGDYHGTHVAGIAAGNSRGTSVFTRGVAGNADIVAVQVFDADGGASAVDIDQALEWVHDQVVGGRNIASVNMSLGGSGTTSVDCQSSSSTKRIVDDLATVGVTVFVAAGNSGVKNGISWPACLPNVVPVGSTTDADVVSSFSNIGPQVASRGVVAPGSGICASVPTSVQASGFGCLSGTSMASPHAAGLAALVKQAKPSASVTEVKAAVRTTPTILNDTRSGGTITGMPRINAWSAIGAVLPSQGEMTGRVDDMSTGSPIAMANESITLNLTDSNTGSVSAITTTDSTGTYRVRLEAESWSGQILYSAALPGAVGVTAVTAGGTVTRDLTVGVSRGSLTGVIDQTNGPFATADITLSPSGSNPNSTVTRPATAVAGDGTFTLSDVEAGDWKLTAQSGIHSSDPVDVTVSSGANTAIAGTLAMIPQVGSISGTMTDSVLGAAVGGATVNVSGTPSGSVGTRLPFSFDRPIGNGGTFDVAGIRSGEWAITVTVDDYFSAVTTSVVVSTGSTAALNVALDPMPGSVSGSVNDPLSVAGFGVQSIVVDDSINITLTPSTPVNGRTARTVTQSLAATGGMFSVPNVTPGAWTLAGTVFGYDPLPSTSLSVSPNGVADVGTFALTRRTAVAVVSPANGTTAGGTTVTVYGKHLTGATSVSFGAVAADPASITVVSDTELRVTSPASPAGTVTVSVTTGLGVSTESVPFVYNAPVPAVGGGGGGGGSLWPATESFRTAGAGPFAVKVVPSVGAVDFVFDDLLGPGSITVNPRAGRPPVDKGGLILPTGWLDVSVTAFRIGRAEICAPIGIFDYDYYGISSSDLRLFHWENDVRRDITTRIDLTTKQVCGEATSFSPFAVGALRTRRVAGADRYETAVEISQGQFSPGVDVVFLATGENFPDALAAGAAAGSSNGPVLLTRLSSLPAITRSELQRLKPKKVLVVGGPAVVSDAVVTEVQALVGAVPVTRAWGVDRFATSVQVSLATVDTVGGTVYIGSGLGFTEVLAGAAAAGRDGAPLLLVPGTGPNARLPLSVGVELLRLKPTKVVILGGSMLVAPTVIDEIKQVVPNATYTQYGGVDAYDTASKVARTFPAGGTVYVATGAVFADGLAGGAVAVVNRSPMVMVPPDGDLQSTVQAALAALAPRQIVVLGGPAAISYGIENAVAKYLPS